MKPLFALYLAICLLTSSASAQDNFSARLFYPMATGEYGSGDTAPYSNAGFGFGVGFNGVIPISQGGGGLGIYVGGDFFWNLLNQERYNQIIDNYEATYSSVTFEIPGYFNIPIRAGLNYTIKLNGREFFIARSTAIYNFHKRTDWVLEFDENKEERKFDWGTGVGYSVGGAFRLGETLTLGVDYMYLGEITMDVEYTGTGPFYGNNSGVTQEAEIKRKVSVLAFSLGFHNFFN